MKPHDAATAELFVEMTTPERATATAAALSADDDPFVASGADGSRLRVRFRAPSIASLRRAVDDVLARLSVSEDVLDAPGLGH